LVQPPYALLPPPLSQYIFTDANFDHPFFLTYFSTSLFTVYLLDFLRDIPWRYPPPKHCAAAPQITAACSLRGALRRACGMREEKNERRELIVNPPDEIENRALPQDDAVIESNGRTADADADDDADGNDERRAAAKGKRKKRSGGEEGEEAAYTFWQIARTSLIFCQVWFAANYSYNKSLSLTSVSSNTILSSTSSTLLTLAPLPSASLRSRAVG
jgi:solute carrier family 35 protein F5